MADYFLDHGAYTSALGSTPTWGVPQEGDGSAIDAATASSVASVQFTANATATSSQISICGVTFAAVASGATGNQFNVGGSLSTTLDNLVTAINASTSTVASGVAVGTPQLRNLVYARKTGTDTLDVMMRIGSATLNNATNSNCSLTVASWTNNGVSNFAGGSGGCWGWFINTAAIGVSSSITVMSYGQMLYLPYVCHRALPTIDDPIYVRTGGGASKTISYSPPGSAAISKAATWAPRLVFDTNTKWTGDSTSGTLELVLTQSANNTTYTVNFTSGASAQNFVAHALRRGGFKITINNTAGWTTGGFVFQADGVSGAGNTHAQEFFGVEFNDAGASTSLNTTWMAPQRVYLTARYLDCNFNRPVAKSSIASLFGAGFSSGASYTYDGCAFNLQCSGAGDPGALVSNTAVTAHSYLDVLVRNCSFTGKTGGFTIHAGTFPVPTLLAPVTVVFENNSGLVMPPAYWGLPTSSYLYGDIDIHSVNITMPDGSFRYENVRGVSEWWPSASPAFPTLSATLWDGTTPWSLRHLWVNGYVTPGAADILPPLKLFNRLASDYRTITVDLMVPSALSFAPGHMDCQIEYLDSTGVARSETVGAFTTSSASWVGTSNWTNHAAKKFAVTTAYQVAQNTDVTVTLSLKANPSSAQNEYLFVDPEFSIQ